MDEELIDDGGRAFAAGAHGDCWQQGMTLRQVYATAAMHALISGAAASESVLIMMRESGKPGGVIVADIAFAHADRMLAHERKERADGEG